MNINLDRIRSQFEKDRFATLNGVIIESASEECVCCSIAIEERHKNSLGGVQGGAIFTLADFAFAVHANLAYACGSEPSPTVGQSCNISFLKGTRGSKLYARSKCISKGRNISVFQVSVTDDLGVHIAEMSATGFTTNGNKT